MFSRSAWRRQLQYSSRWMQKDIIQCKRCQSLQRHVRGYRPIPNPIRYKPEEQDLSYFREQDACAGYHQLTITARCFHCLTCHSQWQWIPAQKYIEMLEENPKLMALTEPRDETSHNNNNTENFEGGESKQQPKRISEKTSYISMPSEL